MIELDYEDAEVLKFDLLAQNYALNLVLADMICQVFAYQTRQPLEDVKKELNQKVKDYRVSVENNLLSRLTQIKQKT